MARSVANDYLQVHRFHLLDIPDSVLGALAGDVFLTSIPSWAGFSSVSIPEVSIEHEEVREGNLEHPFKFVKGVGFGNVVMRKGMTWYDSDFWTWVVKAVAGFYPPRKNFLLMQFAPVARAGSGANELAKGFFENTRLQENPEVLTGQNLSVAKAWWLEGCLPVSYKAGSDLDANSGAISVTEMAMHPQYVNEILMPPVDALNAQGSKLSIGTYLVTAARYAALAAQQSGTG